MTLTPQLRSLSWRSGMFGLALILGAMVLFASSSVLVVAAAIIFMTRVGFTKPAIGLGIVAFTIPLQGALALAVGESSFTTTRLVLIPFISGWVAGWVLGRHSLQLTGPVMAWLAITAALGISIVNAKDQSAWGQELYRWAVGLALLVIATSCLARSNDATALLAGTAAGILMCTGVALWQVWTHAGPETFQVGGVTRAYGLFGEPNPFAAYLEMTVPLIAPVALVQAWKPSRWPLSRYGLAIASGGGVLTLLLTQSRGGYLGLAAALAVVAVLTTRATRTLAFVGIVLAIVVVAATPFGRSAADRFVSSLTGLSANEQVTPENWAVQERVAHWKAGMTMLQAHPVAGVGAGNFNTNYREYTQVWRFRIPRGHAHNSAIQMGAQAGYTGLISYLVLLFTAGARSARGVRAARHDSERALAIGALSVLVAVIVHGQFDYLHGLSLNLAFALAIACAEPAIRAAQSDECDVRTAS